MMDIVERYQYPLGEHAAGSLKTASGSQLEGVTLEALLRGNLSADDLRIHAETLRRQADIAAGAGYTQLAANLSRASELAGVPNAELLLFYEALRPGRATFSELEALAEWLESHYQAPLNARLVREAARAYQARGLLKREA